MSEAIRWAIVENGNDWLRRVAAGKVNNHSVVHKFGRNAAVGTSFVPVAIGGIYRTPQVADATKIRVKAGNAADEASSSGARAVIVQGLDANGDLITNTLTTAGASAGASSSSEFIRLFRAYVSESGSYATQSGGSHVDPVVIENVAGTEDWLTIDGSAASFPYGQSEVGVYSVPSGYKGYINCGTLATDTGRVTDIILFRREAILDTSPPYEAMRALLVFQLTSNTFNFNPESPIEVVGPCDVGFMARVEAATGQVSVDFEILLERL